MTITPSELVFLLICLFFDDQQNTKNISLSFLDPDIHGGEVTEIMVGGSTRPLSPLLI